MVNVKKVTAIIIYYSSVIIKAIYSVYALRVVNYDRKLSIVLATGTELKEVCYKVG